VSSKDLRSGSQAFDRLRWLCDDAQKPARRNHAHGNRGWCPAIRNQLAPAPPDDGRVDLDGNNSGVTHHSRAASSRDGASRRSGSRAALIRARRCSPEWSSPSATAPRPSANDAAERPLSAGIAAARTFDNPSSVRAREATSVARPTACSRKGPGTAVVAPSRVCASLPRLRNSIIATGESTAAAVSNTPAATAGAPGPSHRPMPSAGIGLGGSR